jgi:integrase
MKRRVVTLAPDWTEFRDEFLGFYTPPLYPSATFFSVRRVLDVVEELGLKSLGDLKPRLISRFCARNTGKGGRPITVRTVETQLSYLKLLCAYAHGQGYLTTNPTAARKVWISDGGDEYTGRHLTTEETRAVIERAEAEAKCGDWAAGRMDVLVGLLSGLGLRRAEALGLPVADVDMLDETILIRKNKRRRCKTKKAQAFLPIPDRLLGKLESWLPRCGGVWIVPAIDDGHMAKPWLYGGRSSRPLEQLKGLGLRAGVPGVNFMVFRHTWATYAESIGLSDGQIQRILRHTNPLTAKQFYRHRDVAAMRTAVDSVDYAGAPPPPLRVIGGKRS